MNLESIIVPLKDFKFQPLPDGPHWSPDGGYFWAKGGKYYWRHGSITTSPPCRIWDGNVNEELAEDYSAWSDEKRAEVFAETERKREEWRKLEVEYQTEQEKLIESARAKITEEEFAAIFASGRDY